MEIARRIRKVRSERSRSMAQTALDAGLKPDFLCMVEAGEAVPTLEELGRLAESLNVAVSEFFFDDDQQLLTPRLTPRLTLEELKAPRPCPPKSRRRAVFDALRNRITGTLALGRRRSRRP